MRAGVVDTEPLLAGPWGEAALASYTPCHRVGRLRLTLETTCCPPLSGLSFRCGTFWNVFSALKHAFIIILITALWSIYP